MDLSDGVMRRRSWRWLRTRIVGLMSIESRLQRALYPPPEQSRTNGKPAGKGSDTEF